MSFNVNHLTLARDHSFVLSDVDLSIGPGELVGLLGPNGVGKSSLLAAMAGELAWVTGTVQIDGLNLEQLSALEQAQRRAVVTQQATLNFDLRVKDVLNMGAYPYPQVSPEQIEQWLTQALSFVDLLSLQECLYTELSGGEQQRVQLARALVQCFAIAHHSGVAYLLLDEPLANLDPRHQVQFMQVLEALVRSAQIGVLIVVHDLNVAARYCHRLVLLNEGRVIASGLPRDVLTPVALKQAFGLDWTVIAHPNDINRVLVVN
jgi:iron complex transport system ATP-binding protein